MHSHVALFPNFDELTPTSSSPTDVTLFRVAASIFLPNPSGRAMPTSYFTFMESRWGGCGPFLQTDMASMMASGAISVAIGFR